MRADVVVVGAGPAGLTAAAHLAKCGAEVVLLDEFQIPGGRLLGQSYEHPKKPSERQAWDGARLAGQLESAAREVGVRIFSSRTVWGLEPGWTAHVSSVDGSLSIPDAVEARAVVVATGAVERALPIPGWTLPGVMSIGAAQVLTKVHHIAPGHRVLVVGIDPLALSIIGEMVEEGVTVLAAVLPQRVFASEHSGEPVSSLERLSQAGSVAPTRALRLGARLARPPLSSLAIHVVRLRAPRVFGVPIHFGKAAVEILGRDRVEAVRVRDMSPTGVLYGAVEEWQVDAVCLAGGLYPLVDLIDMAGAAVVDVPDLGGRVPLHGRGLETRLDGLFVAGNVTGIEGATVAAAQGDVVAVSVARYLGVLSDADFEVERKRAAHALAMAEMSVPIQFLPRIADGRAAMASAWKDALVQRRDTRSKHALSEAVSDVVICRCENVRLGSILESLADGASAVAGVKKRTRACMGRCQGRICEPVVRTIVEMHGGEGLAQRARPPVRPLRLGDL